MKERQTREQKEALEKEETFFIDPPEETELNVTDSDPLYAEAYLERREEDECGFVINTTSFD